MQVSQVMTSRPEFTDANVSIQDVAQRMLEQESGFVPIADDENLVGVITDRDMALRTLAQGKSGDDKISTIMTRDILFCYEQDEITEVLRKMRENQVQRLIVLDNPNDKDFIGVVSLSDIADKCDSAEMAKRIVECCKHYR
ncbi:CBS domain-containing protein [Pseudomonas sp. gcc21]|uniref:CBS domain-containing protein n=1 Tax=Pseudomonas sp. gcc21 TaxID=2726989 RepID=UPI0014511A2B|nr:CBS domain-containing protein [Pseudomonas sp. gcc21]QJD58302.1 CBS domain-containing protein [Pseudomonas sp. gcc21]